MNSSKTFSRNKIVLLVGGFIFLLAAVLSVCLGSSGIFVSRAIFRYVRLPRTAACLLAGAGLSTSGAVLQSVLANKLASPSIIGVNAGAGLGVTLCCAAGALSGWMISGAAFLGSLLAVSVITLAAYRTRASRSTVILGGVAVNSILNALSESIAVLNPDAAVLTAEFRVGGFSAVSHTRLLPAGILILAALAVLMTLGNDLDIMTLGDETAQGLGMSVRRTKVIFLLLAALLAGASVSFAGLLGFVGLLVPHFVRNLTGSVSRVLLPACALYGAAFVTLCDLAARTLFAPYELPVGILMSVIGGPFFLLLLLKHKGGHLNG
ncbi:MAG: FecCD family ABC transporter permease [Eubacteriales bacterium]